MEGTIPRAGWVAHQITVRKSLLQTVCGCARAADFIRMPKNVISSQFGSKFSAAPKCGGVLRTRANVTSGIDVT